MLIKDIWQEAPWGILFTDDIVLCTKSRQELKEALEAWRVALEKRGLKVSRNKAEYLLVGRTQNARGLGLQGETMKKVETFMYLGSVLSGDGSCEEEVRKRIQAGWLSWRRVSRVLCNRKLSARVKGRIYKSVVQPSLIYGIQNYVFFVGDLKLCILFN